MFCKVLPLHLELDQKYLRVPSEMLVVHPAAGHPFLLFPLRRNKTVTTWQHLHSHVASDDTEVTIMHSTTMDISNQFPWTKANRRQLLESKKHLRSQKSSSKPQYWRVLDSYAVFSSHQEELSPQKSVLPSTNQHQSFQMLQWVRHLQVYGSESCRGHAKYIEYIYIYI